MLDGGPRARALSACRWCRGRRRAGAVERVAPGDLGWSCTGGAGRRWWAWRWRVRADRLIPSGAIPRTLACWRWWLRAHVTGIDTGGERAAHAQNPTITATAGAVQIPRSPL